MKRGVAVAALSLLGCAAPRPPALAPAPAAESPTAIEVPRELPAAAPPTEVHVTAMPVGHGRMSVWIDGTEKLDVRDDGSDGPALEALARSARAKVAPGARAIFAFDRSLSYGAAVSIIDAFKKVGFARIALAVQPEKKSEGP